MRWLVPVAFGVALMISGCLGDTTSAGERSARSRAGTAPNVQVPVEPPELPAAAWQALPDSSIPRAEHCAANVGPIFFVTGGFIVPHPVSAPGPAGAVGVIVPTTITEIFDAKANTWSQGPAYPSPLDHCMGVGFGEYAYIFHGSGSHRIKVGGTAWEPIPQMPHSHGATGVAEEIDGKIYVAAGSGGGSSFVDIYDPSANTWESVEAAIPQPVNHVAGAAINGKLYAVGGDVRGHSNNSNATQEFDPLTGLWQNRSVLPVVRGSLHGFTWFGHIVVMGGQNGGANVAAFADVNAYDPITDAWKELPKMTNPRHGFAGGVWEDKIYVFQGAPQQGVSGFAKNDVLVPK